MMSIFLKSGMYVYLLRYIKGTIYAVIYAQGLFSDSLHS